MNRVIIASLLLLFSFVWIGYASPSACFTGPCQYFPEISIDYQSPYPWETSAVVAGTPITFIVFASDNDTCGDPEPCEDSVRYSWDEGQTWGTESYHSRSFPTPGTYTVRCRINDMAQLADDPIRDVTWTVKVYTPTYTASPGMSAVLTKDMDAVLPDWQVNLRVTDGDGGNASDRDSIYANGVFKNYVNDAVARVVWSVTNAAGVPAGTVTPTEATDPTTQFHAVWDVPTGIPTGQYTITMKVYDAGQFGPGSVDSADPAPFTQTATIDVGEVTYQSATPIVAGISAPDTASNPIVPGSSITLSVSDGGAGPPYDRDRKFIGGQDAGLVNDTIASVAWEVTDINGLPAGSLGSPEAWSTSWTAPSDGNGPYFASVTVDDGGSDIGDGRDDPVVVVTKTIYVGQQLPGGATRESPEVIRIAEQFCTSIGAADPGAAMARFPAPTRYDDEPTYSEPRWLVAFADGTEVEVADVSGIVTLYTHMAETNQLLKEGTYGTLAYESDATNKAQHVLDASGWFGVLAPPVAYPFDDGSSMAAGLQWDVQRQRQFQGIPYRDQFAKVAMIGDRCSVQTFALVFPSAEPVSNITLFTDEQAKGIAAQTLIDAGVSGAVWVSTEKLVVRPNTFWVPGGTEEPLAGPGCVAYVCTFTQGYYDDQKGNVQATYEVWVDTETGLVIGGEAMELARANLFGFFGLPF